MLNTRNLFVVCDDQDIFDQLKKLIETDDDAEGKVVGTKDGTVKLFLRGESVWQKTKTTSNDKVILIGNVKNSNEIDRQLNTIYYGYGVKVGFSGNYAKITVDEKVVNTSDVEYMSLLSKLDEMPINAEFKGDKKNRDYTKSIFKTALIPFGIISEVKKNAHDIPAMIRKQLYLYAITAFYYTHLTEFIESEPNNDLVLKKTHREVEPKTNEPKNKLDKELIEAANEYNKNYATMKGCGEELYTLRVRSSDLIENVTVLINSISNHPKEFDQQIEEAEINRRDFNDEADYAKRELEIARSSAAGAVAGAGSGAAIMFVAPKAAMWIATTFGTSSTGTAISSLSGAAMTKAALAWLGGGATAAGGGGIAAGQSLLAMAGPIGIGVAAITILSSVTVIELNKHKMNKEKSEEIQYIKQNTEIIREAEISIGEILTETECLFDNLQKTYSECLTAFNKNYVDIEESAQLRLGALVNNTKAMSVLMRKKLN